MRMATEDLKQALLELHKALASGEPIDPELPPLLRMLDIDIQAALAQHRSSAPASTPIAAPVLEQEPPGNTSYTAAAPARQDPAPGLTTRAQEISAKFAVRHPHLEPVLRELTETLQRIGI
ncbi:MAG: hypothetical protein NVSMB6_12900 [Burkholderiaceae bacterium]